MSKLRWKVKQLEIVAHTHKSKKKVRNKSGVTQHSWKCIWCTQSGIALLLDWRSNWSGHHWRSHGSHRPHGPHHMSHGPHHGSHWTHGWSHHCSRRPHHRALRPHHRAHGPHGVHAGVHHARRATGMAGRGCARRTRPRRSVRGSMGSRRVGPRVLQWGGRRHGRSLALGERVGGDLARLEGRRRRVDQILRLLFHPLLVVVLDVVLMFAPLAVGLAHGRRVVRQVGVTVITVVLWHCGG